MQTKRGEGSMMKKNHFASFSSPKMKHSPMCQATNNHGNLCFTDHCVIYYTVDSNVCIVLSTADSNVCIVLSKISMYALKILICQKRGFI